MGVGLETNVSGHVGCRSLRPGGNRFGYRSSLGRGYSAGYFLSRNYILTLALKLRKIAEHLRKCNQKLPGKISSGKMVDFLQASSNVLLISSRLRP
jgi:hypothetical protein